MNRPVKLLRCAIYTRKSTEAGLEQDFNSLDAQREAAEAYIKSQAHEGWTLIPTAYDDGGFSGGSLERPGVQRLLEAVRAKAIDVIVVYKVDRLTRSLADFAKLVELFDANGVSFVSVTQSFNTTTSMGRLTLNVLLSFAQFEREVTAERIRDKIAASKKKGIWMGGPVPLGYQVVDRKLVPEPTEAVTVRTIYRLYLKCGSLTPLIEELNRRRIVTKRVIQRGGKVRGGIPFTVGPLAFLLANRTYLGELVHKKVWHKADHEPIVPSELFEAVVARLKAKGHSAGAARSGETALLAGLVFDDRGHPMVPSLTNKGGVRYRYYVSRALLDRPKTEKPGTIARVSAPDIEDLVVSALCRDTGTNPNGGEVVATSATEAKDPNVLRDWITGLVRRIDVAAGQIDLRIVAPVTRSPFDVEMSDDRATRNVTIGHGFQQSEKRYSVDRPAAGVHTPSGRMRSDSRQTLITAIARARRWMHELIDERVPGIRELAEREGWSGRHLRAQLPLAFVAPEIIESTFEGRLGQHSGVVSFLHNLALERGAQLQKACGSWEPPLRRSSVRDPF